MRARVVGVVLLLVGLLLVAGCNAETRDYQNALGDWSEALSNNPGPELQYDQAGKATGYDGAEAREFVDTLDELLGRLERLSPPQELAADHEQVVTAFRSVCDTQEQFWDAFFRGDSAETSAAGDAAKAKMDEFTDAWEQLTEAIDEAR